MLVQQGNGMLRWVSKRNENRRVGNWLEIIFKPPDILIVFGEISTLLHISPEPYVNRFSEFLGVSLLDSETSSKNFLKKPLAILKR